MTTNRELEKLLEITGSVRGAAFLTDAEYVRSTQGEEGLRWIESALEPYGMQLSYGRVRAMEWLPLRTRAFSMTVMRDLFGWQESDFTAMGDLGPKHSFIIRLYGVFLASPQKVFESAPAYWKKYYTVGSIDDVVFNEAERTCLLRLADFRIHPMYCWYLKGYFRRLAQHTLPRDDVTVEETRCVFKGDTIHEFRCRW